MSINLHYLKLELYDFTYIIFLTLKKTISIKMLENKTFPELGELI